MKLRWWVMTILLLLVLAGTGFFIYQFIFPVKTVDQMVQQIKERGVLVVGTEAIYPPMESYDTAHEIVGFDVEVAREIAKKLGVKLEMRDIPWDKLFIQLDESAIDLVISSVTITPERQQSMIFSRPYFVSGQSIVSLKDNALIKMPVDLAGKRVAAYKDTTSEVEALRYTEAKLVERVSGDYPPLVAKLMAGEVEAIIIDYPVAVNLAQQYPSLKISKPFTSEFYGAVAEKNQVGLISLVDEILVELQKSGRLAELQKSWGL